MAHGEHRAAQGEGSARPPGVDFPGKGSEQITANAIDLRRAVSLLEQGEWQAAQEIVQLDEESPLSCWAHGIVHLVEGDLPNARYWYRRAQRPFPADPSVAREIVELAAVLKA